MNLEVNSNASQEILERNLEYVFRLFRKLSKVGNDCEYLQVVQVNLNNFCYKNNDKSVDIFTIANEEGVVLSKKIIIINVYLPNIRKKCYTKGIMSLTEFERYVLVLCESNISIANEIAEGDLFMKEALKDQHEFCLSDDLRTSYDKELAYGEEMKRTGYDEGHISGFEEGQTVMVKSMFSKGMSIQEIAEKTCLDIQDVEAYLSKNVLNV